MLYVAYGSNLNVDQMKWRCPNSKIVGNGIAKNWKLVFNTHADIIPCEGKNVPVVVWDVPKQDWDYLDVYEGYPKYYVKEKIQVEMENGKNKKCVVYVMAKNNKGIYPPDLYYWKTIKEGYVANNITDYSALNEALCEAWERLEEEYDTGRWTYAEEEE